MLTKKVSNAKEGVLRDGYRLKRNDKGIQIGFRRQRTIEHPFRRGKALRRRVAPRLKKALLSTSLNGSKARP